MTVSVTHPDGVVEVLDNTTYVTPFLAAIRQDPDDSALHRPDVAECGACGRMWDDAVVTGSTPAPSGRCPFEDDHVLKPTIDQIVRFYRAETDASAAYAARVSACTTALSAIRSAFEETLVRPAGRPVHWGDVGDAGRVLNAFYDTLVTLGAAEDEPNRGPYRLIVDGYDAVAPQFKPKEVNPS